jgi:hypothetical protein
MKMKNILLLTIIALFPFSAYSQCAELFATSEEEVYKLYDRLLDSARLSNKCIYPDPYIQDRFGITFIEEFYGADTIMKFEQSSRSKNVYNPYLSCDMPIDFYKRLFDYWAGIDIKENYCMKFSFIRQFSTIKDLLIRWYESGKFNKQDSIKAFNLIERAILESIIRGHNYTIMLWTDDKYITDKIRNALIDVIEHPFYPTEYYDIFMSYQDTVHLDTVGIPDTIKMKYLKNSALYNFSTEERSYWERLSSFFLYEKKGKEQGLSPGQAYLKQVSAWCTDKGYLLINEIAEYAYRRQDELLIKHLKEFKKKHPDYPLEYF